MIVCYWRESNVERFLAQHGRLPEAFWSWRMFFSEPYLEAHQTWNAADSRLVTYQLMPRHARGPSACPSGHVQLFVRRMRGLGYDVVPLGSHLSVGECISLAARSRFFVGVDSGRSHLCHSVRVPVHLVRNQLPADYIGKVTHSGNPCAEYADIPAFLESSVAAQP